MKFVWKDIVKGLLVSMVISSIAGFQDGTQCRVTINGGGENTTSTSRQWCDAGCCRDDDNTVRCCDPSRLSQGMIYGIVITTAVVMLALCLFIRLKSASRRKLLRPAHRPEEESHVTEVDAQEADPPPPYWMCVSEAPPPDVIMTSSTATSSQHSEQTQDLRQNLGILARPPSLSSRGKETLQPPAHGTGLCHPLPPPSSSSPSLPPPPTPPPQPPPPPSPPNPTELTSSNHSGLSTSLSQGVVLQPSSLVAAGPPRPVSGTPPTPCKQKRAGEEASAGVAGLADNACKGTVVLFLPAALAEDVRQSILGSFPGAASQVFIGSNGEVADTVLASVSNRAVSPWPPVRSSGVSATTSSSSSSSPSLSSSSSDAAVTDSALACATSSTCTVDAPLGGTSPGQRVNATSPGSARSAEGAGGVTSASLSGSSVSVDAPLGGTSPGQRVNATSPGSARSAEGAGGVTSASLSGSSVSDILKHLPPGMVVLFKNEASTDAGVCEQGRDDP